MNLPWANKNLGQHFLRDQKVILQICQDYASECDAIIEVGPGPGILTEHLASIRKPFFVIEKDSRFPPLLEKWLVPDQIQLQDALEFDLENFIREKNLESKKIWLVSNLPYNIGTLLLMKFIKIPQIQFMTLMFQKEVADKVYNFISQNKHVASNSLMATTQTYFDCKLLCKVPPGAFVPPPRVDSAVLSLSRIESPLINLDQISTFETFARRLFENKRKQLQKVLKSYYSEEKIHLVFELNQINPQIRAEALELEKIHALYRGLHQ